MAKSKREQAKEELKVLRQQDKEELIRENPMSQEALEVLEHWNSKGIVKHKLDNQDLVRHLPKFLKRYDTEDIKTSIDNYATVFFDKEYKPFPKYEPYRWTLAGFLAFDKHVCEYMSDGQKWLNYCKYKEQRKPKEINNTEPVLVSPGNNIIDELYPILIAALKTMPYPDYIQTQHWQHFRAEAVKHFNRTCQLCGASDTTLDVHHKTYINRGRETFNDVVLLCRHCHDLYHHNKDQCSCQRCNGDDGEHEMTM